ncbi:MAG: membrane protein insertase YidC [Deltaproteobacteria bacterium]|nr:membrane protein insertase YidC [Deltaproteobacteria bacterium]
MDKRLLLAVAISMGILLVWWKLFPPAAPVQTATPPRAAEPGKPAYDAGTAAPPGPEVAAPQAAVPPPPAAAVRPAETLVTLESQEAKFVFSSWGGSLRQLKLKDPQFLLDRTRPDSGMQIVSTSTEDTAPLRTTFANADFPWNDAIPYAVARPADNAVVFRAETAAVAVEKRFTLEAKRYRLQFSVTVENKSNRPLDHGLAIHLYGAQDPEKKGGSFFDYASANLAEMVCHVGDKAQRSTVEALVKESQDLVGGVRWAAAGDKFFTIAAVPFPEIPPRERGCKQVALATDRAEVALSFATRTVAPGQKTEYPFIVFAGPKFTGDLEAVRPGGEDARLADAVDVTFAVLSRPMLGLLKQFHRLTGNWGIAIILLTVVVRLVTFYPTHRTLVSAKKMQGLSDKIAALRKKYENDKQKLGAETMNLYKAHGVNPLGGCLPSLIQMPIWIALFSTLNYAVELYHSSFLWYISDLSAKDPYYLAPLLMGTVMFIQMRMSPAGTDPQQQKMMAVLMPVMFTGFSLFLPAGLSIYTLTSYLIGILQQLYVNRLYRVSPRGPAVPAKA